MRPVWKGNLQIGTDVFPIKLYSATNAKSITLNKFHRICQSKISYLKKCPVHGQVPEAEIMNGYAITEKEYVPVNESDFSQIELTSKSVLELNEFIDDKNFNPLLLQKSYFIIPEGVISQKKYASLKTVLRKESKVALTKIFMKRKEYLAAIWVRPGGLILSTLFYKDEVAETHVFDELKNLPRSSKADRNQFQMFIQSHTKPFHHSRYRDNFFKLFQKNLMSLISKSPQVIFRRVQESSVPPKKAMSRIRNNDMATATGIE